MPLPTFLIIGAGRSGTTSLHAWLRAHPQVFMSPVKEPNYFAFADGVIPDGPGAAWLRATSVTTRDAYEALFAGAGDARAIGEASPRYLVDPDVPARIRAMLPSVRLVAILRNPVERTFATYLAHRRDGYDPAPTFEAALADQERRRREGWPFGAFVDYGFAGRALARYAALFPRERLRVYLYEDLLRDPQALLRDLLAFLDVDPTVPLDVSAQHGQTGTIRNPVVRWLWRRSEGVRLRVGPWVPQAWRDRAYARVMRDPIRPVLRPETREQLVALFREDTLALQALIGRDLSAWLR